MIPLVLLSCLAPQDPGPEGLAAHLESLELREHAEELASRLRPRSRPKDLKNGPDFLRQLRSARQPLLDPALEIADLPADGDLELLEVSELCGRLLGASRRRQNPRNVSLRRFQSLLHDIYGDLPTALGREPDRFERRGEIQSVLERLRATSGVEDRSATGRAVGSLEGRPLETRHLETVDLVELHRLGQSLLQAALNLDPREVERLRHRRSKTAQKREEVVGGILLERETSFGRFVVGGFGDNVYDCTQIAVIVDLGGDDIYRGPAGATMDDRRLGVVVDLAGDDRYEALNDGLGSATYGLGMLVDLEGDDHYSARNRSAGFGAAGLGLFADLAGEDIVDLGHHGGGVGLFGIGFFVDLAGADQHRALGNSFGLGMPGGLGLFADGRGNDSRVLGYLDRSDSRGTAELSMGLGAAVGLTERLTGGVGLFLDGQGHDTYQAGGVALGAGTGGGLGMFFELSGDDVYRSGTGSQGMAHHHGKSLFFEGSGQDDYAVRSGFGLGAASHGGEAWFVDVEGDDVYRLEGLGLGEAQRPAMAGFLDLSGADRYLKEPSVQDPWPARGPRSRIQGALSLFLDEGTDDNRYSWAGTLSPRAGELRRKDEIDGRERAVILLVDRRAALDDDGPALPRPPVR